MADFSGAPEDAIVTFHVKSSGGQKYTLSLPLSTTTIDLKNQLSSSEYADVPASSQRLIYSGKVLKDADTLASYNVKEGNTMHLVKSAPSNQRQNPATQSSSTSATSPAAIPAASGVPQNLAAGTGNDPLAGLTGARYAGFAQLPPASMFEQPTPEQLIERMSDPNFAQVMNEALQNPQVVDMMINQNPQLRAMGPQARQMLQSEQFRRIMTDPEALRSMARMQSMFGGNSFGGAGGGQEAFPAPGITNTTENPGDQNAANAQNPQLQQNPFAGMFGGGMGAGMGANPFAMFNNPGLQPPNTDTHTPGALPSGTTSPPSTQNQQDNPFAALFNPAMFGAPQAPNAGNPAAQPSNPFANNPFMQNPQAMENLMQMFGGGNAGNQFGGMFGAGAGGAGPADSRPPEERYAVQLRQLNEMGFHDFDTNIQALSRSGGDVNGALEWLFTRT